MKISLVVPCYNEEQALPLFFKEAMKAVDALKKQYNMDTEFVMIDDGSNDKTLSIIRKYHDDDPRIRYISFSRNFGKEAGIYAGLKAARGDFVAMMDADLQDPPSLLPKMVGYLLSDEYDCVATYRSTRSGEPPVRSWFAHRFYHLINRSGKMQMKDGARDFRLMKRKMVEAVLSLAEYNRFSKGIFSWVGFRTKWIPYENVERVAGTTKWNFWSLVRYALDGIVDFTTAPLNAAAFIGGIFCVAAFIGIIFIIVRKITFGDPTSGWPSMVCIILLCSGVQLFCTGIIGQYLSKMYLEVKNRPIYLSQETSEERDEKRTDGNKKEE